MGFAVLPALIPDIPRVYDVYFSAFQNDEDGRRLNEILFPGGITKEFREAHTAGTLEWWNNCPYQYTMKCVDTDNNEIVGMALADIYLRERPESERKNPGAVWLEGKERERADNILDPLEEVREKVWGPQKYIYCHVMAVEPKHQGRHAGVKLAQWAIDLSEQTGVPVYLEASPKIWRWYEKMGFRRLKEEVVHHAKDLGTKDDVAVPLMVKLPSKGCDFDMSLLRE